MASPSREQTPQRYAAFAAAVALHLFALAGLGLVRPLVKEPYLPGAPAMQVSLPSRPGPMPRAVSTPGPARPATPRPALTPPALPSPLAGAAVPAEESPSPLREAGPGPGCEREVLILLTATEKERCRNQIDAESARRSERNAAAEAARRVREARQATPVDHIASEKRAAYDAVQQAKAARREDFSMRGLPRRDGPQAGNDSIDINVGGRCTMALGGGRLGRPSCRAAPPGGGFLTGQPP